MPTVAFNHHFPGYEILGEIGRSNARVLKARNQLTGEKVAIKHFPINTDEETIRRFRRESEIMTSINHPNIVKIKEVSLQADIPFIVMELIEGGDLRSLLEELGSLDVPTVIRLGLQMVHAFEAIHEMGIIHRDIKPENIMYRHLLGEELHFLLTDFGTAKLREQSNTVTGKSMMTYEYASPEQFEKPKSVTAATDYYSMGIILYECLVGHVPFMLGDDGLGPFIQKVIGSQPPLLKLPIADFLPVQLNSLIKGLLAKNHKDRIKEPAIVRSMLQQAEVEDPVKSEVTTPTPLQQKEKLGKDQNNPSKIPIYVRAKSWASHLIGVAVLVAVIVIAAQLYWKHIELISGGPPNSHYDAPTLRDGGTITLGKNVFVNRKSVDQSLFANRKSVSQSRDSQERDKGSYIYMGGSKNGKREGDGIQYLANGEKYEGKWKNGYRNGFGTYTAANGAEVENCPDCEIYKGNWVDGIKQGFGKCYDKVGRLLYSGQFKDDKPVGNYPNTNSRPKPQSPNIQTLKYNDGKYVGQVLNNQPHGKGTYRWNCGAKYVGDWLKGSKKGKGAYYSEYGDKIEGDFLNDQAEGHAVGYFSDGSRYEGKWKNGYANGFGTCTEGNNAEIKHCPGCKTYTGNWVNGIKQGFGRCYDKFGRLIHKGQFKYNKPVGNYPMLIKEHQTNSTMNEFFTTR